MADKQQPERKWYRPDVKAMKAEGEWAARTEGEYIMKTGKHLLRFLPPLEPGPFFFKYFYHRVGMVGSAQWPVCPKFTWKGACPVCALGDNLYKSKDPDEIKQGRELWRKTGYVANVIDVREPAKGVQVLFFGKQVRDQLVNYFADPEDENDAEGIDITDPERGATVRITKTEPEEQGGFSKYICALGQPKPLPPEAKGWIKQLRDLKSVIQGMTQTRDELAAMVAQVTDEDAAPGTASSRPRANGRAGIDEDDDFKDYSTTARASATRQVEDDNEEDPVPVKPAAAAAGKPAATKPKAAAATEDDDFIPPRRQPGKAGSPPPRHSFPEESDEE